MKKIISVIIVLMFALSLFGCSNEQTRSVDNKNLVMPSYGSRSVVAFGDSIAAGYGLESQKQNYVNIFSEKVGATLRNHAVSGYDSDDLLKYLKNGASDYDIKNANIIILSIGGNDLLHEKNIFIEALKNAYLNGGEFFTDKINGIYSNFSDNLSACLAFLKSKNPNAMIIVQTVYNPAHKQGYKISVIDAGKLANKYIDKLNDCINEVCQSNGTVYVFDVAEKLNSDAENFYNLQQKFDIHPTVKGHQTLAEVYTENFNLIVG